MDDTTLRYKWIYVIRPDDVNEPAILVLRAVPEGSDPNYNRGAVHEFAIQRAVQRFVHERVATDEEIRESIKDFGAKLAHAYFKEGRVNEGEADNAVVDVICKQGIPLEHRGPLIQAIKAAAQTPSDYAVQLCITFDRSLEDVRRWAEQPEDALVAEGGEKISVKGRRLEEKPRDLKAVFRDVLAEYGVTASDEVLASCVEKWRSYQDL
jgi:hypothetical protein